jgi:hypothetical protein
MFQMKICEIWDVLFGSNSCILCLLCVSGVAVVLKLDGQPTRGHPMGCQNSIFCEPFGRLSLKWPCDERTPAIHGHLQGVLSSEGPLYVKQTRLENYVSVPPIVAPPTGGCKESQRLSSMWVQEYGDVRHQSWTTSKESHESSIYLAMFLIYI